jgi:hypothetical protein
MTREMWHRTPSLFQPFPTSIDASRGWTRIKMFHDIVFDVSYSEFLLRRLVPRQLEMLRVPVSWKDCQTFPQPFIPPVTSGVATQFHKDAGKHRGHPSDEVSWRLRRGYVHKPNTKVPSSNNSSFSSLTPGLCLSLRRSGCQQLKAQSECR